MARENLVQILKTVRDQTATSFIIHFLGKKVVDKKIYYTALNVLLTQCPIECNLDWLTLLRKAVDSDEDKALYNP